MAETDQKSGSLNRELFERTLRYVSSAESTQDASTRDAQDAVLDSLPPQELDPRDQVVPGVPRPRSQSRDSSGGGTSGTGLFDDSGAAESRRTRRLRRACRWLKRGIIWSILWTGIGLCVMAPPYGSKEDEGQISPSETLRVAIRLLGGAWIGHVIAAILRVIALVTQGTIFETVIEAADWIALESICCSIGTWILVPSSHLSFKSSTVRNLRLVKPLKRRLNRYIANIVVVAVMWVIQELIALNTIQQWTRKKFSERVDRLGAAFGLLKSLVRVARAELAERNKVRGRSSPAGFHAPQTLITAAAVTKKGLEFHLQSLKVAMFFGVDFGSVNSKEEARDLGTRVFSLVRDSARRHSAGATAAASVRRDAVAALAFDPENKAANSVPHADSASREMFDELFPPPEDRGLKVDDFTSAFTNVYVERRFLSATISGTGSITGVVKNLIVALWVLISLITTFFIWNGDVTSSAVILGGILVGLSWAVGEPTARFIASVSYVLLTDPQEAVYDVGDRVFIQNVEESCPEKSGFAIIVQHIGPARVSAPNFDGFRRGERRAPRRRRRGCSRRYTTFLSSFNEEMKISNVVLADKTVLNHSRSPKPALRIAVHLSARTPPHEIAALREAVFAYVDEHPKAWRYASIVHIDGFELGEGWVRLAMWLTSASPGGFHDWKTLYQDRHRFYMWLHTYIVEANLVYCSPTVPLLEIKDNAADIYKKRQ